MKDEVIALHPVSVTCRACRTEHEVTIAFVRSHDLLDCKTCGQKVVVRTSEVCREIRTIERSLVRVETDLRQLLGDDHPIE